MARRRNAQEAFGQLSAFAAAKQAHAESGQSTAAAAARQAAPEKPAHLASAIGAEPYDPSFDNDDFPSPTTPRPNVLLSSFDAGAVQDDGDSVEVTLQAKQAITLVGEYGISVLKGLITIYGSILHPASGPWRVYALSTSALPPVTAIKHGSVIRVTSLSARSSITRLERCSPLFRSTGAARDGSTRSFAALHSSADDPLQRPLVPLHVDEDAKKVLSRCNARLEAREPLRVMAVGPKSSGKSTFNRLLCNMITSRPDGQRCMYLDLDPGQPEFGPPGQISLVEVVAPMLGPPFTHPASAQSEDFRLIRSHTLAAVSFKDDPELYINCVKDLTRHVSKSLPLVVNSSGWISGLGAAVILKLARSLSLTDIPILHPIDMHMEEQLSAEWTAHHIRRNQGRTRLKAPVELRAMQTMAYFHQRSPANSNRAGWFDKPIEEKAPWIVDYTGECAGITAILSYGQMPHPDFLNEVIDGAVVAVVVLDPDHPELAPVERAEVDELPYIFSQMDACSPPVDPQHSQSMALALVRGIDVKEKKLHLVTPLADSQVAEFKDKRIVLVRGSFDSPDWAYLEGINANDDRTPSTRNGEMLWVSFSDPVGIEASVWRLRHPPLAGDARKT